MSKYFILGVLILAVGVGNIYKFSFFSPDVNVSVLDFVVFILTILNFQRPPKPLLFFLGMGLLSLVPAYFAFGYQATLVGLMYLVRFGIYSLFLIKKDANFLIMGVGITLVLTGLIQYLFFPDIRSLAIAVWDLHYYRVVGSQLDPGFMGIMLLFFLVYLLQFKTAVYKFLWAITYMLFALTYSRSSFLAYFVVMAFLAWRKKSWKFLVGMWLLLALTLPLLPRSPDGEGVKLERTSSIQARIDNWSNSLIVFRDHPILGVGFNTYRYAQIQYGFLKTKTISTHSGAGADSSLLFVAATTGVIGLTAYVNYLRHLWSWSDLQPYLMVGLIHSWFLNSLFYPWVLLWLGLIMASKLRPIPVEPHSPPSR